ncbi:hypothetical protein GCM10010399_78570 [Dactylosporangium fulvum]|uniref:Uncharacterized protein n=1 Tax=Dactylosporangium fulvum TaxID=53359 RepID=A0ABY5W0U7_9ACTN|nr:hypothetical protein [Dactylosporangium fulvum]UWP82664.1 hypothetical protein Dfulv_47870 [Dactylosporangium fulvum]
MDLTEAMYAATRKPPPTSIDVDAIIAGERRRSRRIHRVTAVAAVAAVAVGAVVVPRLHEGAPQTVQQPPLPCLVRSPTAVVTADPEPSPVSATESCGAAVVRLSAAVTAVVTRELPGLTLLNPDLSPLPVIVAKDQGLCCGYTASFRIGEDEFRYAGLSVTIMDSRESNFAPMEARCPTPGQAGNDCTLTTDPATGSVRMVVRKYHPGGTLSGFEVHSIHPDGTHVLVNGGSTQIERVPPPFTEGQMIAIAEAPELTAYP